MKKIQLHIPEPCHENWENMSLADKGRFCAACQKTVIDFTQMSDRQLADYFKDPANKTCGRFYQDQLGRPLVIPKKPVPWLKYVLQVTFPALFATTKMYAQGKVRADRCTPITQQGQQAPAITGDTALHHQPKIHGRVVDPRGEPVAGASILLEGSGQGMVADMQGKFTIIKPEKKHTHLVVSAVGFEEQRIKVENDPLTIVLSPFLTGEVVVVGAVKPARKKIPPLISKVMDTVFKNFSVYPNPVVQRGELRIDMKKLEAGAYTVSVIDMGGLVVQTEEARVEKKKKQILLRLNPTAPGTYLIHLFNRKTAASFTEKIIVQ